MSITLTFSRAAFGLVVGVLVLGHQLASAATNYSAPAAFNRPGFTETLPWDINDSGLIVGSSDSVGFIYNAGVFSTFVHPDAATNSTNLTGVANDGTLVGSYWIGDPDGGKTKSFIYAGGSLVDFNVAGATETLVRRISSDGRYLTGSMVRADASVAFAFDRNTNSLFDLAVAGDSFSMAQGANILGQVTGSFNRPGGVRGSFVVDLNTMERTEYLTVAGMTSPRFRDINDSGDIAGFVGEHAFVGKPGDWTLFAPEEGHSIGGYGLNNSGTLVGFSFVDSSDFASGWVATPVPEPSSWALMALGLAGLTFRKRRQASIAA